jgi:hypothetical protein
MDIDFIIAAARRDSRRVGGMELRALCLEIERLRSEVSAERDNIERVRKDRNEALAVAYAAEELKHGRITLQQFFETLEE